MYTPVGDRVKFGTAQTGGQTVTTVTYSITDGDNLDEDNKANGIILDPSGSGVQIQKSIWSWWTLSMIVLACIASLVFLRRRMQQHAEE